MLVVVIGVAGGLAGVIVGQLLSYWTATWMSRREEVRTLERERRAARRDWAWRAEEEFRPYLYELLKAARKVSAVNTGGKDVGNIDALDESIDRLETAPLTRRAAAAAVEMRIKMAQYEAALRSLAQLQEQMSHGGDPLRPDIGERIGRLGDETQGVRDGMLRAAYETRQAVHDLGPLRVTYAALS